MKKNLAKAIALAMVVALYSCSNDSFFDNSYNDDLKIQTKSAKDKVFTATIIDIPYYWSGYSRNYLAIDSIGDIYTFVFENSKKTIKKYDLVNNQIVDYITLLEGDEWDWAGTISIDKNQHLYLSNGKNLIKVYENGKSTVDLTSRITGHYDDVILGMCASYNDDIFFSWYGVETSGLFKLAPNGKVTLIDSWGWGLWEQMPDTKGGGIFKPKGSFVYTQNHFDSYLQNYYKVNTKTGSIPEKVDLNGECQSMTASIYNSDIYILRGFDIFKLRPNKATDLLVGTIPNSMETENGEIIRLAELRDLWVNGDGSVFYISASGRTTSNYYKENIYKLTLD